MAERRKLTPKQKKFADEYLATGNACEAYRRAYDCSDMLEGTVRRRAQDVLNNSLIKAYTDKCAAIGTREALDKYAVTRNKLVRELAYVAFSNMQDYISLTEDGLARVDFSHLSREQSAAIQSIKVDRVKETNGAETKAYVERVEFKLADKLAALQALGKLDDIAMFVDRRSVTIENEFSDMSDEEIAALIQAGRQDDSEQRTLQ